jgi:hypothetical protein
MMEPSTAFNRNVSSSSLLVLIGLLLMLLNQFLQARELGVIARAF